MSALGLFDSDPAGLAWEGRGSLPGGPAAQEHVRVLDGHGLRLFSLENNGTSLGSHGAPRRDIWGAALRGSKQAGASRLPITTTVLRPPPDPPAASMHELPWLHVYPPAGDPTSRSPSVMPVSDLDPVSARLSHQALKLTQPHPPPCLSHDLLLPAVGAGAGCGGRAAWSGSRLCPCPAR